MSAVEVYPGVTVDERVRWGRPCVKGTGVTTDVIAGRFKAHESLRGIAEDYDFTQSQVLDAIRWECLSRRQQLRRIEKARAPQGGER